MAPETLNSAFSLTLGQIPAYRSWVRCHQVWVLGKGQKAAPLAGTIVLTPMTCL